MASHSEIYKGWKIESYNHPTEKYRFYHLKRKNQVLLGDDINHIKKQIDHL